MYLTSTRYQVPLLYHTKQRWRGKSFLHLAQVDCTLCRADFLLLMSSFPECTEPDTVTKGGYSARSSSEPHPHPKKQRITSSSSSPKKLDTSSGIADRLSGLERGEDESKLAFEVRVRAHRKLLRMVQLLFFFFFFLKIIINIHFIAIL